MAFKGASTARAGTKTGKRAPVKKKAARPKAKKKKPAARPKAKKPAVKKPKAPKAAKAPKKSKTRTKIERKVTSSVEKNVLKALQKPAGAVRGGAVALGKGAVALGTGSASAGLASLGVAGSAAALAVAFAVGYGIGTAARSAWTYLSLEERRLRQALAFREARFEFERKMGRPPNAPEVKEIGRSFLEAVAKDRAAKR